MTNESKISKIQTNFKALSEIAPALNTASDELTKSVSQLDDSLKKLNLGLAVWVTFRYRGYEEEPQAYDEDQIGYTKVNGVWGIALRHIWGDPSRDEANREGPWLFNDASREMRLLSVDKIPDVIEQLAKEALNTRKKIEEKTQEVRDLAKAINPVANEPKGVLPSSFQAGATMPLSALAGNGNQVAPAMRRPAPKLASPTVYRIVQPTEVKK